MHSCAAAELCRLGLQLGRQLVNNTGQTKLKLKLKWQAHGALSGAYLDQNYLVFLIGFEVNLQNKQIIQNQLLFWHLRGSPLKAFRVLKFRV